MVKRIFGSLDLIEFLRTNRHKFYLILPTLPSTSPDSTAHLQARTNIQSPTCTFLWMWEETGETWGYPCGQSENMKTSTLAPNHCGPCTIIVVLDTRLAVLWSDLLRITDNLSNIYPIELLRWSACKADASMSFPMKPFWPLTFDELLHWQHERSGLNSVCWDWAQHESFVTSWFDVKVRQPLWRLMKGMLFGKLEIWRLICDIKQVSLNVKIMQRDQDGFRNDAEKWRMDVTHWQLPIHKED